ncbi:hypothetical protein PCANC_15450 [Puccinia coronata f. sp. avenae]|uniref:Uncharacterized protein n=1 Tax=Puccinia coronata f. sp. avenae TaxID=200324 RepID=A0A2N5UHT1_9BASI|nr:hypothetical protein PCANC_15450 [Puccinia coronata f. sp. avenae]
MKPASSASPVFTRCSIVLGLFETAVMGPNASPKQATRDCNKFFSAVSCPNSIVIGNPVTLNDTEERLISRQRLVTKVLDTYNKPAPVSRRILAKQPSH